ncbi:hypothetical protein QBC39DRAFT_355689 [Podospora conica]|nr:hypothetical protein QBC39DRAFT_355689 [Schizothecium conicum]
MPISDLLASITGDSPTPSPTTTSRPASAPPKRKATDELRLAPIKAPRTESLSNGSSRPQDAPSRPLPRPADKPAASSNIRPGVTRQLSAPSSTLSTRNPSAPPANNGARNPATSRPSQPLVNRPAVKADTGPPKKRSYAEIMARAQATATVRASLGVIQHKPVEKTLTMKERKELKAEEARKARKPGMQKAPAASSRYGGTAAASRSAGSRPGQPNGGPSRARSTSSKEKSPPVKEEKKVKKAALATTGYTGTARPRPGATPAKPGAAARPAQRTDERQRPRYGGPVSRPRRNDDYDDELDDFIEYDDDEEEPGYGRGREYMSGDDESDMEAGISDIDQEESRAERLARLEDAKEKALEERLRREKEARKAGRR